MKYYAVRKGRAPGIYTSWPECQDAVKGYSGCEYKSFSNRGDAEKYLGKQSAVQLDVFSSNPNDSVTSDHLVAWVDGSFNKATGEYGSGIVLVTLQGNHEGSLKGAVPEFKSANNVAGEIMATVYAIEGALKLGAKRLTTVHDYVGIQKWAVGDWSANSAIARYYTSYLNNRKGSIVLDFIKVDAHTGVDLNERADTLAKAAVGL